MNIIYFGNYSLNDYHASAGSKRVLNQIKYLVNDNEVKVVTISEHRSDYKYNLNLRRYTNTFIYLITLPFYWFIICWYLIKNKKKGQNIVLLQSVVELNFAFPVLFCKLVGYKVVHDVVENFFVSEEELSASQKSNLLIIRLFYKLLKYYTDGILVISERLMTHYSVFRKPIIKLYNSVEINFHTSVVLQNKNDTFSFIYSGTFDMKDGVKYLIQAFNIISATHPNSRLILTGKSRTKYFHECLELIRKNEKICYLGYLSPGDLENEYKNANVTLVTRDNSEFANNGFPFKLSEYLSFQKPVIASSVSDIPLLFSDYEDLLLVEPSNTDSIVQKMEFSLENRNALQRIAENGFKKCNEYFSISKNGETLNDFLKNLN